ncbi:MAG: UDP-N-acetylglucosamine 2-epimerase (non-hydrolyzing) [Bacteroidota bacterium]
MIKILTVVGARPQIIKAAALSRAIKGSFSNSISEIILHTGQHYDQNMSQVFFDELGVPSPDFQLNTGSQSHGKQTAHMITGIEEILLKERPDFLVVYGDTNSTLAGAIAASKIHIPIAHIEAGLRSFNKSMPEEINRIMCDHASTLLFTPTRTGLANLEREGFVVNHEPPFSPDRPGVFHCGDIMLDNSRYFSSLASEKSSILSNEGLDPEKYLLVTIHRDNNTDDSTRLTSIFDAILQITEESQGQAVIPLHPRTSKKLPDVLPKALYEKIKGSKRIKLLPPASFFDMIVLEKSARIVLTDSGGVQKEAYFFNKPCIIARSETEWVEIIEHGTGILADADTTRITEAYKSLTQKKDLNFPPIFGDGRAAEFMCKNISNC